MRAATPDGFSQRKGLLTQGKNLFAPRKTQVLDSPGVSGAPRLSQVSRVQVPGWSGSPQVSQAAHLSAMVDVTVSLRQYWEMTAGHLFAAEGSRSSS